MAWFSGRHALNAWGTMWQRPELNDAGTFREELRTAFLSVRLASTGTGGAEGSKREASSSAARDDECEDADWSLEDCWPAADPGVLTSFELPVVDDSSTTPTSHSQEGQVKKTRRRGPRGPNSSKLKRARSRAQHFRELNSLWEPQTCSNVFDAIGALGIDDTDLGQDVYDEGSDEISCFSIVPVEPPLDSLSQVPSSSSRRHSAEEWLGPDPQRHLPAADWSSYNRGDRPPPPGFEVEAPVVVSGGGLFSGELHSENIADTQEAMELHTGSSLSRRRNEEPEAEPGAEVHAESPVASFPLPPDRALPLMSPKTMFTFRFNLEGAPEPHVLFVSLPLSGSCSTRVEYEYNVKARHGEGMWKRLGDVDQYCNTNRTAWLTLCDWRQLTKNTWRVLGLICICKYVYYVSVCSKKDV